MSTTTATDKPMQTVYVDLSSKQLNAKGIKKNANIDRVVKTHAMKVKTDDLHYRT